MLAAAVVTACLALTAATATAPAAATVAASAVVPADASSGPSSPTSTSPPSTPSSSAPGGGTVPAGARLQTVQFSAALNGVGCVAGTLNCIVIGDDGHGNAAAAPVADGLARPARAYPDIAELYGAACTSQGICLAVGKSAALQSAATGMVASLRPDGALAPSESNAAPATSLNAIACPRACLAVGWAGGSAPGLTAAPVGTDGGTTVPATRPTAGAGMLQPIALDGVPGPARLIPGVGDLLAIGCAPDASCLAVGYNAKNTAGVVVPIAPDGIPGRARSVRGTTTLEGVACPAPAACVAVGFDATRRSGSVGVIVTTGAGGSPRRAQQAAGTSALNAVACPSPLACEAVGWLSAGLHASRAVAAQVDQGKFAGTQTVADDAALYGIACAPRACLASGNTDTGGVVTLLSVQGAPAHRPPAPPACHPTGAALPPPGMVARLSGVDRDATAVRVSEADFPGPASAQAVVLASNAEFPDALAGTPLAVAVGGPLLLTPPADLDPVAAAEISRVLPPGGTVYLLGGDAALSPAVAARVAALGDVAQRVAGADRFATAVAVAAALGDPSPVLEATGTDFPDALSAGAAAAGAGGAVLLTEGRTQAPETAAYLAAHPGVERYAIGHPAAVADPRAIEISGSDRYETAVRVAEQLLHSPGALAFAAATSFPDALAGGAAIGAADGAVLLVPACGALPTSVGDYLGEVSGMVAAVRLYGGRRAVGDDVVQELDQSL